MNVHEAIQSRRATRHFDPNHELTEAELRQLCSAFALAPSSFNMQNRHAVAVTDQETKDKIMAAAWGQEHIGNASVVFVIAGVMGRHHDADKFLRDAAKPVQEMFKPMVMDFYEGKESLQRDEACRSVGMAAMNLMLEAQELGFNSCPLIGFDPAQVADIVGLDEKHPALMLVVVGKATGEAHPRLGLYDLEDVVSVNQFDNRAITGSAQL